MNKFIILGSLAILATGGGYYYWAAQDRVAETVHTGDHVTKTEPEPLIIPAAEQIAALEKQFINDMIPHHEEAVASSQQLITFGTNNAEVLKLAKDIVAAQKAEIDSMKEWHVSWYGEVYKDTGAYQPMMRNITTLSGVERDKAFLEDMIQHHLHALAMVQDVAPQFVRPELKELSQDIASSQSNEVVAMKILLRQL